MKQRSTMSPPPPMAIPPPTASPILGPQPGNPQCCDSCRIVAAALARLADAVGYEETARELRELLVDETEKVGQ